MAQLRTRSEREVDNLVTDCLYQVSKGLSYTGWDTSQRLRMRDLVSKLGLLEPTANPGVSRLHDQENGRDILRTVSEVTGISTAALQGEKRGGPVSKARQLVFLLCNEHAQQMSTPQIGRLMNRDHTTVIHGTRKARERIQADPDYKETYDRILSRLAWEK